MKRLFFFATALLLFASCGQSGSTANKESQGAATIPVEEIIPEPTVPMVYSNAYDGFANIRYEPSSNGEIAGQLRNGPRGAEYLGVEGKWTKVNFEGCEGYVLSSLVQSTPTKPVNVDPGFIAGAWRIDVGMGPCDYIVFTDGSYAYYHDSFCEGAISEAGKWHLEENSIIFTKVYSFVNEEVDRSITRFTINTDKHQIESVDGTYKRAYYDPAKLEAYRKQVKPYVNL